MLNPRPRPWFALRLTWRWSTLRRPGDSALDGLELLLRFLGLETASAERSANRRSLLLRPLRTRDDAPPTIAEALYRIRAWEAFVLNDYPGTSWEIRVESGELEAGAHEVDAQLTAVSAEALASGDRRLMAPSAA